jgi:hypothetical protein
MITHIHIHMRSCYEVSKIYFLQNVIFNIKEVYYPYGSKPRSLAVAGSGSGGVT